jgi:HEAT repeat protein
MRKKRFILLAGLLALLLCVLGWLVLSHSEPEPFYQGKLLSAWLKDLRVMYADDSRADEAGKAIRHMGRDAVPFLINLLERRESSRCQRILRWAIEHHLHKSPYVPVTEDHHQAVLACYELGPEARPAIPALIALLSDDFTRRDVGNALVRIGSDALIPIIGALTNTNNGVRQEVVVLLAAFRSNTPVVIPALVKSLNDTNKYVRSLAARSLGQLGQAPEVAIPALERRLTDPDAQVRWCACHAIGQFKQQALSEVPPLLAALADPDPEVRSAAAIALVTIDPKDVTTLDTIMPCLIEALIGLKQTASGMPLNFRYPAIMAVEKCGERAQMAASALVECLQDREEYVREAATNALRKIDPAAAAKVGVK